MVCNQKGFLTAAIDQTPVSTAGPADIRSQNPRTDASEVHGRGRVDQRSNFLANVPQ